MRRLWILVVATLVCGCTEQLVIRSVPPGAQVTLNGSPVGTTPMVYQTRDPVPLSYHIEAAGLPPAEGTVATPLGPGRVVGAIFTLGIVAACRPLRYFTPNPLDVNLGEIAEPAPRVRVYAALRLYNVKSATVLEGECVRETGSCWVRLPSGEHCDGDFVRGPQGSTTVSSTTPGTHAEAFEATKVTQGVAVLKCRASIIDCKLTLDASALQGHGECTDTRGITYRATLIPAAAATAP